MCIAVSGSEEPHFFLLLEAHPRDFCVISLGPGDFKVPLFQRHTLNAGGMDLKVGNSNFLFPHVQQRDAGGLSPEAGKSEQVLLGLEVWCRSDAGIPRLCRIDLLKPWECLPGMDGECWQLSYCKANRRLLQ